MTRPPVALLGELLDAAERADDFVTGVVGLAAGRIGGDTAEGQSWLARRLSSAGSRFQLGKSTVVEGFGAVYGPEQLRKAAEEADRLNSVLDELRSTGEVQELVARLDRLGVPRMPAELRALTTRSPELRDLQDRLIRAIGATRETRTKLLLTQRRRGT